MYHVASRSVESRNAADNNSISRVLGSSAGGAGGRGGKNEPVSTTEPKPEECLVIDDCVEDDDPVYIKFNYDNKENEFVSKLKREREAPKLEHCDKVSEKEITVLSDLFKEAADDESLLLFQISEALQLHDIPQSGHIGKLRVHKSGRIDLCINDSMAFDVALSASGPFYQVRSGSTHRRTFQATFFSPLDFRKPFFTSRPRRAPMPSSRIWARSRTNWSACRRSETPLRLLQLNKPLKLLYFVS